METQSSPLTQLPSALLFDVDGVMVDVRASYRQAILSTVRSFGGQATEYDILTVKLAGNANNDWQVSQTLLEKSGVSVDFDAVKARFEDFYQGTSTTPGLWINEIATMPAEAYASWSQRLPLAIVTGRPRQDASKFLQHFAMTEYFGAVVCMEDAPLKPSAEPARLAIEKLGNKLEASARSNQNAIWMLGDTPDDMCCAVGANCTAVGIMPPGESSVAVEQALLQAGACVVFESLDKFFDQLNELWRKTR